ncbi:hypothetical protein L2E82_50305 [Cichorium intybus]|nr:hypothetical protein L2E82_50305 [Cichorium intybus]
MIIGNFEGNSIIKHFEIAQQLLSYNTKKPTLRSCLNSTLKGAAIMTLLSLLLAIVYDLYYASPINVVVHTSRLELGVETPPIRDNKKPPMTDGKKPPKPS